MDERGFQAVISKFRVAASFRSAFVRRARLSRFGYPQSGKLPVAEIRLTCGNPDCRPLAASITSCLEQYRRASGWQVLNAFRKTAAVTSMRSYDDFSDYLKFVAKETNGKYRRSANKARREGFYIERIGFGAYAQSLFDIRASKRRRSHGIMSESRGELPRPTCDQPVELKPFECMQHWRVDWGLFRNGDSRMLGFASLIRAGNLVQIDHMIAHADILSTGGTKLMQFDIMEWLFARNDPAVVGVEHVLHGAIEDGNHGAADWRRYVRQLPSIIRVIDPQRNGLPDDFDPKTYLILNPDLRAAHVNAKEHYLRHGSIEGRAYKIVR